jgi:ADP-ribosylglycohydrolase
MIANTIGKPPLNGDAWCVATLANCLSIAGGSTSVMEGIEAAVRMGGDTDTNAAIVGTLLGARLGFTMELIERKDKVINIAFADNILSHYTAALKV